MVAAPSDPTNPLPTMSWLLHGNNPRELAGPATAHDNYSDATGAYGYFIQAISLAGQDRIMSI